MQLLATRDQQEVWLDELVRPYLIGGSPFVDERYVCVLFVNDETVTAEEQTALSQQLVRSGCRYAVCAGHECSSWDDAIDRTADAVGDFDGNDERFVFTTWHERDSVEDVIFYGLINTAYTLHDFSRILILFIGGRSGLREEVESSVRSVWRLK